MLLAVYLRKLLAVTVRALVVWPLFSPDDDGSRTLLVGALQEHSRITAPAPSNGVGFDGTGTADASREDEERGIHDGDGSSSHAPIAAASSTGAQLRRERTPLRSNLEQAAGSQAQIVQSSREDHAASFLEEGASSRITGSSAASSSSSTSTLSESGRKSKGFVKAIYTVSPTVRSLEYKTKAGVPHLINAYVPDTSPDWTRFPLYVLIPSAGDNFWAPLAQEFAFQMAQRGYVAAEIDYDRRWTYFRHDRLCTLKDRAPDFFQGPNSAVGVLCADLPQVDCSMGIAVHGIGQGGYIAHWAKNYIPDVRATLFFAVGDGLQADEYPSSKWADITGGSDCYLDQHNPLPRMQRRYLAGENDQYAGGTPPGVVKSIKGVSGYSCGSYADCLQPDGSGYMVVPPAFYADSCPSAPHYFFQEMYGLYEHHYPVCQFLSYSRWAMHQSLEWLAQRTVYSVGVPYEVPYYPLKEKGCVFCPLAETDLYLREVGNLLTPTFWFGLLFFILLGLLAKRQKRLRLQNATDFDAEMKEYHRKKMEESRLALMKTYPAIIDLQDPNTAARMAAAHKHQSIFDMYAAPGGDDPQRAAAAAAAESKWKHTEQAQTVAHTENLGGFQVSFTPTPDNSQPPIASVLQNPEAHGHHVPGQPGVVPSESEDEPTIRGTPVGKKKGGTSALGGLATGLMKAKKGEGENQAPVAPAVDQGVDDTAAAAAAAKAAAAPAEAAAQKQREEEAARQAAAEQAAAQQKAAEEAAAAKAADEEATKAAAEKAQRKAERAAARQKAAEEEAARQQAEQEAAQKQAEEDAAKAAEEKAKRKAERAQARKAAAEAAAAAGEAAADPATPGSAAKTGSEFQTPESGVSPPAAPAEDAKKESIIVRTKMQIFTESGESRSAGLDFTKEFAVKTVEPGGQADEQGIKVGWQMVEFAGTAVGEKFKLKRVKKALVESGATEYEIAWNTNV
ncbi:unnamed protein product [Amoebophrya sp. A120]|nr:unnamed protein product [Amoebophrya sp. A120]|eukprot:GSA120T00011640001.1